MGNADFIEYNEYAGRSDVKAAVLEIRCAVSPEAKRFAVRLSAHAITVITENAPAQFGSRSDDRVYMVEKAVKKYICMYLERGCRQLYIRLPELAADEKLSKYIGASLNRINGFLVAVQNIDVTYILPEKYTETYSVAADIESETDVPRYACKCTRCGRFFDLWDAQQNFSFDSGLIGYGSIYDGHRIKADLCCDCFDELMLPFIKECVTNPSEEIIEWGESVPIKLKGF